MPLPTDIAGMICPDQNSRRAWNDLCRQLTTPAGVTPFVGAGLSIPYGYPGWGAFLIHEAPTTVQDEVKQLLAAFKYEDAAQIVSDSMSKLEFRVAITDTFGKRPMVSLLNGAAEQLPALTNGPVVTTNYDPVLEQVFEKAKRPFEKIVVGPRPFVTMGALHSNSPVLVKLHGTFDDPQDRIITLDEYNDGYGPLEQADQAQAARPNVPALLNQIFGQRPLLFLGCSLQQDRTMSVLESTVLLRQGVSHYAILERPKDDDNFQARKKFLGDRNIRCIWYPNGEHGNLGLLLAALAKNVSIPVSRRDKESTLDLTFSDVCEPERSAVDALLASTDSANSGIVWHRKIADVIDQLKDWKANFDVRIQIFAWFEMRDQSNNQLAFRSDILKDYDTFVRTEQLLLAGLHKLLRHTARASYEERNVALRSYAGLAAMKITSCLWTFQKRVWNAQTMPGHNPEPVVNEYTFLPQAQYLSLGAFSSIDSLYLIPPFCDGTPIAALALPHLGRTYEQFLVCRLLDGNGLKNPNLSHGFTIVLPQTLACRLFRNPSDRVTMKKAYYSRILPAWLAMTNRPGIPSLRSLHIFVVQDKNMCDFKEC